MGCGLSGSLSEDIRNFFYVILPMCLLCLLQMKFYLSIDVNRTCLYLSQRAIARSTLGPGVTLPQISGQCRPKSAVVLMK
jgi:hypothetical protein